MPNRRTVKPLIEYARSAVGNRLVDHSDSGVVGAPVGAAPTTSSFSTEDLASIDCANTTARPDEKHLSCGFGAPCIRGLTVTLLPMH